MDPVDHTLYLPLSSPTAIRTLKVLQRPPGSSEPISCELEEVSLEHSPSYAALSYTWGPPSELAAALGMTAERTHQIVCNNSPLLVTQNLHDFLLQFIEMGDDDVQQRLWIDAICINQEDDAERASQVSLMTNIYRGASRVIAWLGVEDEWTKEGFEDMRMLASCEEEDISPYDPRVLGRMGMDCVFTMRSYFSRAWIVQEVVLARRIVLQCGPYSIPWDDAVRAVRKRSSPSLALIFPRVMRGDTGRSIPERWEAERSVKTRSLLRALALLRRFDAKDQRDKVYAALGIVLDGTESGLSRKRLINPVYGSRSVAETYLDAARVILGQPSSHGGGISLLTFAGGDKSQHVLGLPSWVPDWSITKDLGVCYAAYDKFDASKGLPSAALSYNEPPGNLKLTLSGVRFDNIVAVGESKDKVHGGQASIGSWISILDMMPEIYHTGQNRIETFWRTLVTDVAGDPPTHPAPPQYASHFRRWIGDQSRELPKPLLATFRCPNDVPFQPGAFQAAYVRARYQRLFLTAGGYIGLSSESTLVGDVVWFVQGSRTPLILRGRSDDGVESREWSVVGGGYLHGAMHGEAVQGRDLTDAVII